LADLKIGHIVQKDGGPKQVIGQPVCSHLVDKGQVRLYEIGPFDFGISWPLGKKARLYGIDIHNNEHKNKERQQEDKDQGGGSFAAFL
jgi:hypothetical protein